jgi:hypothetical protein
LVTRRLFLVGAAAAALAWAGQAAAATIVYDLKGTGSGHIGGVAFTDAAYDITATGDTAHLTSSSFYYALDPLSSVSIAIAGVGDLPVTVPLRFGEVPNLGFFFGAPAVDILDGFFDSGLNVDISLPFGPVTSASATTDNQFIGLPTRRGLLWMTATSNITYSATGGAGASTLPALLPPGSRTPPATVPQWYLNARDGGAGAVPEPSTWALAIAGFALAGLALRRRRPRAATGSGRT